MTNALTSEDISEISKNAGVGLDGSSGHSTCRRWRFAYAAYGPFTAAFIIFFAKDMYVLKLGADTSRTGTIAAVWSVTFPIAYLVSGHIMDKDVPLFTKEGWGRRAPWFMTHIFPLALICFLIFLPGLIWVPEAGSMVLDAWLAVCLIFSAWCLPVLLNAIESARAEIYPFKEERVIIEAMTKFVGVFAAASGIVPQMVLWINATMSMRFVVSCFLFFCVLSSLEAVPILKDARQPYNPHQSTTFAECFALLRSSPMLHASLIRFWHSAADTTVLNFGMYYITFVDGFDSADRAKWMFISGLFVACMEFVLLVPFWGFVWSNKAKFENRVFGKLLDCLGNSMRTICCALHVLGAILPPLCLRLLPELGVTRPWEWTVYCIVQRFCYSPQAFFRVNSFCWAVDDDCHRQRGSRREALHAGVAKFLEDEGRALAFAVFLGLGWAGLQTENCELICEDAGSREDCVRACDQRDILRQPEAVAEYIKIVLTFIVPAFGLICALHIWLFPIHGQRLKELTEAQATVFKKVQPAVLGVQKKTVQLPGVQTITLSTARNE